MFQALLVKRLFKMFYVKGSCKISSANRQRNPSTVQECFERPEGSRGSWKPCLFITLLLPTIYYMFYYKGDAKSRYLGPFSDTLQDESKFSPASEASVKDMKYVGDLDRAFPVDAGFVKEKHTPERITDNLPQCATVTVTKNVTVYKTVKQSIHNLFPTVDMGGHYIPPDCRARHKVAILVPYRNREEHLKIFLYNIHPFLMRQRLEYRMFVIEQNGTNFFNKGRLFNAGFLEIQKTDDWQCIIFHDVDLLPTDDRIRYTCPILPRHMCATVVEKEQIPKYRTSFGGVTAMTMWQYKKVNGYSNLYWGWGAEDDDMLLRLQASGIGATRYNKEIARYMSLKHPRRTANRQRHHLLQTAKDRYQTDGLSSLRYLVTSYASYPLYTHIVIDVDPPVLQDYITESSVVFSL